MNLSPILAMPGPFLRNIHHSQIQHFQLTVIRRKNGLGFGHFPRLLVKSFDCVRRIDQAASRFQILKISVQIYPVIPPGFCNLRLFDALFLIKACQTLTKRFLHRGGIYVKSNMVYILCGDFSLWFHLKTRGIL